jgi:hypothetical protein
MVIMGLPVRGMGKSRSSAGALQGKTGKAREKLGKAVKSWEKARARWLLLRTPSDREQKYRAAAGLGYPFLHRAAIIDHLATNDARYFDVE